MKNLKSIGCCLIVGSLLALLTYIIIHKPTVWVDVSFQGISIKLPKWETRIDRSGETDVYSERYSKFTYNKESIIIVIRTLKDIEKSKKSFGTRSDVLKSIPAIREDDGCVLKSNEDVIINNIKYLKMKYNCKVDNKWNKVTEYFYYDDVNYIFIQYVFYTEDEIDKSDNYMNTVTYNIGG